MKRQLLTALVGALALGVVATQGMTVQAVAKHRDRSVITNPAQPLGYGSTVQPGLGLNGSYPQYYLYSPIPAPGLGDGRYLGGPNYGGLGSPSAPGLSGGQAPSR